MNKMIRRFTSLVFMAAMSTSVWAATRIVTLDVPGMTCSTCPITIKKALHKVPGVTKVEVKYDKKQAVVSFDDTKTDTKTLVKATTDAGYPSTPEETNK